MIIADDEFIVRDGLRSIVEWESLGVEIIAEAVNGQEAYDLCVQLNPDIILTDIRMPLLDGLEVAMKLQEEKRDIKVIIISGIQDFSYVKTALDVNAEGYILKPIKINELNEVVKKVAADIYKERNRKQEMYHIKQQLYENLSVIREKFLRNLLIGVFKNEQEVEDKLNFFNISLKVKQPIVVCVLQVDNYTQLNEYSTEEDKQLLSFSILNILDEHLTGHNSGISFCLSENEFILIFSQNNPFGSKLTDICGEISSCLKKFLKISVSIGIGCTVNNCLQIKTSYKDACTALNYKFYTGENSIISIDDINSIMDIPSNRGNIENYNLFECENQLINIIKLGDCNGVAKLIKDMFCHFSTEKGLPVNYVQSICTELICITSRSLYELDEDIQNIISSQASILTGINYAENIFDLQRDMLSTFTTIAMYFANKHSQKNGKIIKKVKEIIEKKYMEDISTSKISDEIYLTPNYISQIFSQETGETIAEYITKVRMENAKELLKTTDFKILEVAEMVGFKSPQYFSNVFKKYTGIHPQKFRSCL